MSTPVVSPSPTSIAGSFIADSNPPAFTDPSHHPVQKLISGSLDTRKTQLIHSPNVEGFIFVSNNKLITMYLARISFDLSADPQEQHPLIIGALGSLCAEAIPASVNLHEALSDSLILEQVQDATPPTHSFTVGKTLTDVFFTNEDHPDRVLPRSSPTSTHRLLRLPACIPKLKGQPILEGSIFDDAVVSALENYCADAGTWINLHVLAARTPSTVVRQSFIESIDASFLPPFRQDVTLSISPQITVNILLDGSNVPNSPRHTIQSAIQSCINMNTNRYRLHNPQPVSPYPVTPQGSVPPTIPTIPVNPSTPPSSTDTFTCQGLSFNKKYERPINTFRAMLSVVNGTSVRTPTLRKEFLYAFQQSSAAENARYATKAMKEHDIERAEYTRDYLQRLVTGLHWNQTTTSLYLNAIFHTAPLDEHKDILKASVSFLTFLAPPPEASSSELQEYLKNSHIETMQAMVGESNEKKEKISLKTFQGGLQRSPQDVLVGISNLESRFSFITEYSSDPDDSPLIVTWLLQLAHIFSSPEFKKFHSKYSPTHPWIPHAMVTQVHILFAMVAKVASNFKVLQALKYGQPLSPDIFQMPIRAFASIVADIQSVISGAGAGIYNSPPLSYTHIPQPSPHRQHTNKRRQDDSPGSYLAAPKRHSPSDKGWITASGRYLWPKNISGKQLCNRFAQIGSSCPNGTNCPFSHRVFPKDFDSTDRDIICRFVHEHPNVAFAS